VTGADRDLAAVEAAVTDLRLELGEDGPARHPYRMSGNGIWWMKPNREGGDAIPIRLTNFQARIVRDVVQDDGLETRHLFEVEGRLPGREPSRQSVPAGQFASLAWVLDLLGAEAILETGNSIRDRARVAIQYLSQGSIEHAHVYTHTGWHRLPTGEAVYLHAGGAIGRHGTVTGVEVALPGAVGRFRLPEAPTGVVEREAVRASLSIADPEMAPDRLTIPVLAAAYRAPLGATDMSLLLVGESGLAKSELAALAQQHFGPEMDREHLPANFQSTANFNLGVAFAAADALLVVDEFKPSGSRVDRQRLHAAANTLLTAQGNLSGRGRAATDGSPRAIRDPRGLMLVTGEEVPEGYSARARTLIIEFAVGDVEGLGIRAGQPGYRDDRPRLTHLQRLGREGQYARAVAGYVRWLAERIDDLPGWVRDQVAEVRGHVRSDHARTATNMAQLFVGVTCFLQYARSIEAVTEAEAATWRDRAWAALSDAADRQEGHHRQIRPERRFMELLMSAIASGRAHVADRDGLAPDSAEAWGWRARVVGTGQYAESHLEPQGARVGWLADGLYLDKAAAFRAAVEMDADNGIGVSVETLVKRLHEGRYLASVSAESDGRLTVQRRLEGTKRRVLHLRSHAAEGQFPPRTGDIGDTGAEGDRPNSEKSTTDGRLVPGGVVLVSRTGDATGATRRTARSSAPVVAPVPGPREPESRSRPGTVDGAAGMTSKFKRRGPSPTSPVSPAPGMKVDTEVSPSPPG
jgi:hypothetical protein